MPHHKSAVKRLRQSEKARLRNVTVRSRLRTAIKKVRAAKTAEEAQQLLTAALPLLDKTVQKGIIHRNAAARYKSRLTRLVNAMRA